MGRCYIQSIGVSTHKSPVCVMTYGFPEFQTQGQACDRRSCEHGPATIMYASEESRETVRIALMIAALNDLEVKSGNISSTYVEAPVTEKVWTTMSPVFGNDARKIAVIVRVLYDL